MFTKYTHLERALCKIWQVCVGVNFLLFQISRFLMVLGGQDCAKSDKLKLHTIKVITPEGTLTVPKFELISTEIKLCEENRGLTIYS